MKMYYLFKPQDSRVPLEKVIKVANILQIAVTLDTRDFYYPSEYDGDSTFMNAVECLEDFLENTVPSDRNLMESDLCGIELVWFDYEGQDAIIRVVDVAYGKLDRTKLPFGYSYSRRRREGYVYNIFGDMLFTLEDTDDLFLLEDTVKEEIALGEIRSIIEDSPLGYIYK